MHSPSQQHAMRWFRTHARSISLALLTAGALEACTHWVAQPGSPSPALSEGRETVVRVTLANGRRRTLLHPRIENGTLIGPLDVRSSDVIFPPDSIPLTGIRSLEVERVSAARTTVVLVGLGVTAAVLIASLATPSKPAPPPTPTTFSCPVVYSWNGHEWIMDSGTFGGAIMQALQRTDVDNLDFVKPSDGVLRLKVANILDETEYVDALHVLAVDHDPDVTVAPDGAGVLHTLGPLAAPLTAVDFDGRDALARVRSADGWNWESTLRMRDTANVADIRDGLELSFLRPHGAARAHLVIDGNNTPWAAYLIGEMVRAHGTSTQAWYDSLNARPEAARAMGAKIAGEAFLGVQVRTRTGWTKQGIIWEAGPEVVKRQVLDLDLSQVPDDTVRVRLESVPSFWLIDRVALDFTADRAVTTHDLEPAQAIDARGRDVRPLLTSVDGQYFVMQNGESAELRYTVPPVPAGRSRSYVLKSTGWYAIRSVQTEAPNVTLLRQLATERYGISRTAVARLNEALQSAAGGVR